MSHLLHREPLDSPWPWRGAQLLDSSGWRYELTSADLAEIESAMRGALAKDAQMPSPSLFPLPGLSGFLRRVNDELKRGSGVVKITGLPVQQYSDQELRCLYLGISAYLGTVAEQNGGRGRLRDICDQSAQGGTRVDSADGLNWHNDRADIVGLLGVREARHGGVSRIVSVSAIHNEMLKRCPDLLDLLFEDFERYAPGDEVGGTTGRFSIPILRLEQGVLKTHYSRTYIELAASRPGAQSLSKQQRAAIDTLVSIADEFAFEMPIRPGEMQFLNNQAILHGRTPFQDVPDPKRGRLLLRVWLSIDNSPGWQA